MVYSHPIVYSWSLYICRGTLTKIQLLFGFPHKFYYIHACSAVAKNKGSECLSKEVRKPCHWLTEHSDNTWLINVMLSFNAERLIT